MKGLFISLTFVLSLLSSPCLAASSYKKLTYISGSNPNLELFIHKDDQELNLAKKSVIRLQLKVGSLYTAGNESKSFLIVIYDISNGVRRFVSTEAITINPDSTGTRTIEVDAGRFASSSKTIEIDLLNTERVVINTYSAALTAINTSSQTSTPDANLPTTCNSDSSFIDCIDVFFRRVVFEAIPQKKVQTRIIKDTLLNTYKVKVPITSLKGIDSLQIDPRSAPPADPSLGEFYVDDSEAICVYVNDVWVRLAGPGSCQ